MTVDRHTVRADVAGQELNVLGGTITMDDTRAPLIQGTLIVTSPPTVTEYDPRNITRVHITLKQRFGDVLNFTSDLSEIYGGQLTSDISAAWGGQLTSAVSATPGRSYSGGLKTPTSCELLLVLTAIDELPDGTTELTVKSDETLVIGLRFMSFSDEENFGQGIDGDYTLREAIERMLAGELSLGNLDAGVQLAAGNFDYPLPRLVLDDLSTIAHLPWRSGQSMWDALQPALQFANARLIGLGDGTLRLIDADEAGTTGPAITVGENLVDYTLGIDRESQTYGDAVVIRYSEPNGIYQSSVAVPDVGTYSTTLLVEIDGTCPVNQFSSQLPSEPAARILERARRRGFVASAVTVNDYSARPRQITPLELPEEAPLTSVRQSIRWDIRGTWEMQNTLQEVEPAT